MSIKVWDLFKNGKYVGPEVLDQEPLSTGHIDEGVKSLNGLVKSTKAINARWEGQLAEVDNLEHMGGYLDIGGTSVKALPSLVSVGGDLVITDLDIPVIPKLKSVAETIQIGSSYIPYMPNLEPSVQIHSVKLGIRKYSYYLDEIDSVSVMDLVNLRNEKPYLVNLIDAKLKGPGRTL